MRRGKIFAANLRVTARLRAALRAHEFHGRIGVAEVAALRMRGCCRQTHCHSRKATAHSENRGKHALRNREFPGAPSTSPCDHTNGVRPNAEPPADSKGYRNRKRAGAIPVPLASASRLDDRFRGAVTKAFCAEWKNCEQHMAASKPGATLEDRQSMVRCEICSTASICRLLRSPSSADRSPDP